MRFDKKRVLEYVKELRRKGVSSTITLYAIRDLKGEERRKVLRIKPPKKRTIDRECGGWDLNPKPKNLIAHWVYYSIL